MSFTKQRQQVWAIEATGEVFIDYEKYLSRYGPSSIHRSKQVT
jgi:hypothetical protein